VIEIQERDGGVTLRVRVVPRASRSMIAGEIDGAVKIRIASPPVDGAANEELVRFLAKLLGVGRSSVQILAGQTSKNKIIGVSGISVELIRSKLA